MVMARPILSRKIFQRKKKGFRQNTIQFIILLLFGIFNVFHSLLCACVFNNQECFKSHVKCYHAYISLKTQKQNMYQLQSCEPALGEGERTTFPKTLCVSLIYIS